MGGFCRRQNPLFQKISNLCLFFNLLKYLPMETFHTYLPIIQIVLSIILIIAVLLQQSGSSLGAGFGGDDSDSSTNTTRRGFEKTLLKFTLIVAFLFVASSFYAFLI